MKQRETPFSEDKIRSLLSQMLQGLVHIHRNGYFHRDLKPENLLVTNDIIKIADFGLAREVSSIPPYTDYVSTRWYRAPEVLLRSATYTPAIDMWAVGAVLAELFTLSPIFPGESELDQLYKICCVLGSPNWNTFPEAQNMFQVLGIHYTEISAANLSDVIPNASPEAIDLIKQLCSWDPLRRPTADECLRHPFFNVGTRIPHAPRDPLELKLGEIGSPPNLELNLWDFRTHTEACFLGLTLAVNPSVPNMELVHKNQAAQKGPLQCHDFLDRSHSPVFWSLFPPDHSGIAAPIESSLSLSFSNIHHPSVGVPQSPGLAMASMQSNILDRPLLTLSSSPFPHRRYL
ncbi:hypothetical protein Leryth_003319 [Lithospermum erythrorhizon]|nr:hypothetical protein Leryth_003319 [Lithospermum erythrorhizon]